MSVSTQGALLVNLGSPNSPSVPDVRRYLREFLMDSRVIDAPYPVRFGIVHFGILPSRPKLSAEAYHKIWSANGSPLVATGKLLRAELERRLNLPVELGMRYQNPSIDFAIRKLRSRGVRDVILIPLFPHYAMSSYETAVEQVRTVVSRWAPEMTLEIVPPFFDHPAYIEALTARAAEYLRGDYDSLLFSFHGLPERHLKKSDPTGCHCLVQANCCGIPGPAHQTCYRAQCYRTVEAFVKNAGVTRYSVAFQSRLGKEPWIQPYTDEELVRLARDGVRKLLVMCPAFVADCLETLEEIGMRGRQTFLDAGGTEFTLIPCLNDHPAWIDALEQMVNEVVTSGNLEPASADAL
jgi:ferrochelatase